MENGSTSRGPTQIGLNSDFSSQLQARLMAQEPKSGRGQTIATFSIDQFRQGINFSTKNPSPEIANPLTSSPVALSPGNSISQNGLADNPQRSFALNPEAARSLSNEKLTNEKVTDQSVDNESASGQGTLSQGEMPQSHITQNEITQDYSECSQIQDQSSQKAQQQAQVAPLSVGRRYRPLENGRLTESSIKVKNLTEEQKLRQLKKIKDSAEEYEGLLLKEMIKSMRQSPFAKTPGSETYSEIAEKPFTAALTAAGGLGLAQTIISQVAAQEGLQETLAKNSSIMGPNWRQRLSPSQMPKSGPKANFNKPIDEQNQKGLKRDLGSNHDLSKASEKNEVTEQSWSSLSSAKPNRANTNGTQKPIEAEPGLVSDLPVVEWI
jgi:Rod binding domain-containing protein